MTASKKTNLRFPLGQDIIQAIRKKVDAQERIRTLVEEKQTQRIFITKGWVTSLAGLESSGFSEKHKSKKSQKTLSPKEGDGELFKKTLHVDPCLSWAHTHLHTYRHVHIYPQKYNYNRLSEQYVS